MSDFISLARLGDTESTALYNAAVNDLISWLAAVSSSGKQLDVSDSGFVEFFLKAAPEIWDKATLDMFVALLDAPRSETDVPAQYVGVFSLREVAAQSIADVLPWIRDANAENGIDREELDAAHKQFGDSVALYTRELKRHATRLELARKIARSLDRRGAVEAALAVGALLPAEINHAAPQARTSRALGISWHAAALGSWRGIEFPLMVAREPGPLAETACRALRRITGNNFQKNWDVWDWWLAEAKAQLHWDVYTNSWQPADQWEELQKEALARLEGNGQ